MSLKSFYQKGVIEAGCDEAGRGCLAGPVVAAAVIMPDNYSNKQINDSKKTKHLERLILREEIQKKALCWAVEFVDNILIDKINILKASILAMHKALEKLSQKPQNIIAWFLRIAYLLNLLFLSQKDRITLREEIFHLFEQVLV